MHGMCYSWCYNTGNLETLLEATLFKIAAVLLLDAVLLLVLLPTKQPILDVKHGQRVVAVSDPEKHTLTLIAGADELWICAPYEHGHSCKPVQTVVKWLPQDGETREP